MADMTITVGAQVDESFEQFKKDINELYNQLNSKPLKVKIQFDESSVKSMQSQITALYDSVNKLNSGSSGNAATQAAQQAAQAAKTRATAEQQTVSAINQRTTADQKAATATKQTVTATNQATTAAEQDAKAEISRANAVAQYNTRLTQIQDALKKYTAAEYSRNASSREAYAALEAEEAKMLSYKSAVDSVASGADKSTASLSKMKTMSASAGATLKQQVQIIKDNEDATRSLTDRAGSLFGKFSSWLTISQTVMFAVQSMKKLVTSAIELDTAMTELKKVTDETNVTYDRFLENASSRAVKIGASLTDIVSATADFARLGYDIEDASNLADAASVYKNVGDGIDNISEASESIIATMQAFGIEASDAMSIVDKFNEVGNNFAISSEGVGEALLRSAAAMKAAGNTIDETIALIAAANTIVQDPDKVGTTLKTMSMYLRAAKTEAEEAGESTDGMASSVSELREELLALTGNKVDIQLDEDTFKSTYEILKELSAVWDDLSDITQANITELIGGKRNANVVSALLENFSIAEEALATSSGAAGSAMAENEKYLDSIQGKIDIMEASFQTLASDFASSDFLKGVVSAATELLNILDGLISKIGTFPTIIGAIGLTKLIKIFGSSNEFALYGCESIVA